MLLAILQFFERRKYRVVRYGEVRVGWQASATQDGSFTIFSIIFLENDHGKRKWKVSGGKQYHDFNNTSYYAPCQTWKHTGLFPEWAKDPMAEKLVR